MLFNALTAAVCLNFAPNSPAGSVMTLPIAATDVQVRLTVPAWESDDARLALLRKNGGAHILAAGLFGAPELRVTFVGGPAHGMDGAACRAGVLGDRLLGMGVSEVAGFAVAATIRDLNPPYREIDRHAFLLGAGAMVHMQVIALEQADPEKFGDAGFEQILKSTRFAVVRRTDWDDLPERYLELSNAAARRTDGAAWLHTEAAKPGADWLTKMAALEHATASRSTEDWVIQMGADVRAELMLKTERSRAEDAALLSIEDGLALALLRAGEIDAAQEHADVATRLATRFGDRTVASVSTTSACLRAVKKDADGVVTILTKANEVDPTLRYRLQAEKLLDPVREDERVADLLTVVLQRPSGRTIGR